MENKIPAKCNHPGCTHISKNMAALYVHRGSHNKKDRIAEHSKAAPIKCPYPGCPNGYRSNAKLYEHIRKKRSNP